MANIVRIRMPSSDYGARLVGVTGTPTAGEIVSGSYNQDFDMHEFQITITGRYQLFLRAPGESQFHEDAEWGGTSGKILMGDDFDTHFNGHGKGEGGKIKPEETTFAEPIE